MFTSIDAFIEDESGATIVEYGVIAALILGACLALIKNKGNYGNKIASGFNTVATEL